MQAMARVESALFCCFIASKVVQAESRKCKGKISNSGSKFELIIFCLSEEDGFLPSRLIPSGFIYVKMVSNSNFSLVLCKWRKMDMPACPSVRYCFEGGWVIYRF